MSETEALFSVLRQSADADCACRDRAGGTRRARPRPLPRQSRSPSPPSTASTRSARSPRSCTPRGSALFELSWNVLCPGCGGVLDAGTTLKTINREEYDCGLCAAGYKPTLDEMVEVTFTVSPRVRRIAAHSPDTLAGSRILPADFLELGRRPAGDARGQPRRVHGRFDRAAARRKGGACRCNCRTISSSCSIR